MKISFLLLQAMLIILDHRWHDYLASDEMGGKTQGLEEVKSKNLFLPLEKQNEEVVYYL